MKLFKLTHPVLWLSDLLEPLFPKYKISEYYVRNGIPSWVIRQRWCILGYKTLRHLKSVRYPAGHVATSYEILIFHTEGAAESEMDRLNFGYPPITGRLWENHVMLEEYYKK